MRFQPLSTTLRRRRVVLMSAVAGALATVALLAGGGADPAVGQQDVPRVTGTWSVGIGTQSGGDNVQTWRIRFQDGGSFSGDGDGNGLTWNVVGSISGTAVHVVTPYTNYAYSATFEGTVSADGSTMSGTFTDSIGTRGGTWHATHTSPVAGKLDPLPKPDRGMETARVQSIRPTKKGGKTSVTVTRGGRSYAADENSILQNGDVLRTDKGTVMAVEFLIGGRVGVNSDTEIEMVSERSVADSGVGTKRGILKTGSMWLKADAHTLKQPIEIQTNGGILGIRD